MKRAEVVVTSIASLVVLCALVVGLQTRSKPQVLHDLPRIDASVTHVSTNAVIEDMVEITAGYVAVAFGRTLSIFDPQGDLVDTHTFPFPAYAVTITVVENGPKLIVKATQSGLWTLELAEDYTVASAERLEGRLWHSGHYCDLSSASLLCASADGKKLVMSEVSEGVFLCSTSVGEVVWSAPSESAHYTAFIDEDGSSVYVGTRDLLNLGDRISVARFSLESGERIWEVVTENVMGMFDLDDDHLVALEEQRARVMKKSDGGTVSSTEVVTPARGALGGSGESRLFVLNQYNDTIALRVESDLKITPVALVSGNNRHAIATSTGQVFKVGDEYHILEMADLSESSMSRNLTTGDGTTALSP